MVLLDLKLEDSFSLIMGVGEVQVWVCILFAWVFFLCFGLNFVSFVNLFFLF